MNRVLPEHLPDEVLLPRVADGDEAAWLVLTRRWNDQLYAMILKITLNEQDGAEALNDTWRRVGQSASTYRGGEGRFGAWAARIACNEARRQRKWGMLRFLRRAPHVDVFTLEPPASDPEDAELLLLAWTLHRRQALDPLLAAFQPQDQTLICMKAEGANAAEIAQRLGCKPGAVRVRWHRLKARLSAALEGQGPADRTRLEARQQQLVELLQRLSPAHRHLVALKTERWSDPDIAEALGCTADEVRRTWTVIASTLTDGAAP
ncbi:MAG: hypothetical protein H6739_23265 [Alphaproteobacteria bacterium]|nr:hypothetical protein [Alphaproteobacteria bacterium]